MRASQWAPDAPDRFPPRWGSERKGGTVDGLRVSLLGPPRVVQEGATSSDVRLTRLLLSLLGYLLVHRDRSHPRDVMVGVFWGEESDERGRSCLTTALWRLRGALGRAGGEAAAALVVSSAGDVRVDSRVPCWLDVAQLEDAAREALRTPPERAGDDIVTDLAAAVRLYRGDLLEGYYDDWVLRERERLRMLYQHCLLYLMQHYAARAAWDESLGYGALLLQHDPLREDVHREVMRLYARSGQRALAVRQYELCRAVLAEELAIEPMEETTLLYRQLVAAAEPRTAAQVASAEQAPDLAFVLQKANAARRTLEATVDELKRLISMLETPAAPLIPSSTDDRSASRQHLLDL
jgi:DNA-binding SARP family transcriptional activator